MTFTSFFMPRDSVLFRPEKRPVAKEREEANHIKKGTEHIPHIILPVSKIFNEVQHDF